MKSIINSAKKPKRRGRPEVESEAVNVRITKSGLESIDRWRRNQEDLPGRPEAIRRLVEIGLNVRTKPRQAPAGRAARAKELASQAIDSLTVGAPDNDETATRKRRLIKGPEEFHGLRVDHSAKK